MSVILIVDNQFGSDGPMSGDRGRVVEKFMLDDEQVQWYRVAFEGFVGWFALPAHFVRNSDKPVIIEFVEETSIGVMHGAFYNKVKRFWQRRKA